MSDQARAKQQLRDTVQRMRAQLPSEVVTAASERACELLLRLQALHRARTVALYAAVGGELDPLAAGRALQARGVRTLLPRIIDDRIHLSPSEDPGLLVAGHHGIPEPAGGSVPLDEVDAVVVPGVAFDLDGWRLGRGGGHYDRLLATLPTSTIRIALAHTSQLVTWVPREEHDEPVDIVVTDRAVHHTGARAEPRDA